MVVKSNLVNVVVGGVSNSCPPGLPLPANPTLAEVKAGVKAVFGSMPSDVSVTSISGGAFQIQYGTEAEFEALVASIDAGCLNLPPGSGLTGPPPATKTSTYHGWGVYFPAGSSDLQGNTASACGNALPAEPTVSYDSAGVGTVTWPAGNRWSPGTTGQIEVAVVYIVKTYIMQNGAWVLDSTFVGRGDCP